MINLKLFLSDLFHPHLLSPSPAPLSPAPGPSATPPPRRMPRSALWAAQRCSATLGAVPGPGATGCPGDVDGIWWDMSMGMLQMFTDMGRCCFEIFMILIKRKRWSGYSHVLLQCGRVWTCPKWHFFHRENDDKPLDLGQLSSDGIEHWRVWSNQFYCKHI